MISPFAFQVRHDDWWALASQYTDDPSAQVATSHDLAFLSEKLWYVVPPPSICVVLCLLHFLFCVTGARALKLLCLRLKS